nr:uncharacterized protein LOC124216259 [Neodiprion pinetum]
MSDRLKRYVSILKPNESRGPFTANRAIQRSRDPNKWRVVCRSGLGPGNGAPGVQPKLASALWDPVICVRDITARISDVSPRYRALHSYSESGSSNHSNSNSNSSLFETGGMRSGALHPSLLLPSVLVVVRYLLPVVGVSLPKDNRLCLIPRLW